MRTQCVCAHRVLGFGLIAASRPALSVTESGQYREFDLSVKPSLTEFSTTERPVNGRILRLVLSLLFAALATVSPHVDDALARDDRVRVVIAAGEREAVISSIGRDVDRWGDSPGFAVELTAEEIDRLARDPRVLAIDLDSPGGGSLLESLPIVRANVTRALGFDGRGVTVAVVDTGIDLANADFAGRIVAEQCYCSGCCPNGSSEQSGAGSAADDHGHGTHVAGIIAGGGASAPMGIAPAARIVAVKVMDRNNRFSSFTQIYRGLLWIRDTQPDVRVINASLGTDSLFPGTCDTSALAISIGPVISDLRSRGTLMTVSAGNQSNLTSAGFPACFSDSVTVGATYDTRVQFANCYAGAAEVDDVTCFSNSSTAVDLVAPGAFIRSVRRGGGAVEFSGTSMAAPHVAGAIALMLQANPNVAAARFEQILRDTARPIPDRRTGKTVVRLDVAAAVAAVPSPSPSRRRAVGR